MSITATDDRDYASVAKWLHWLMAAIILCMIPAGLTMTRLGDGPVKNQIYDLHKSFGMIVFTLAVVRAAWRVSRGAPPPVSTLTPFLRVASLTSHRLLYVLIFFVPIVGWIGTSMCCGPVQLFGMFDLTLPIRGDEHTAETVFAVHRYGAYLMTAILLVHISAAFFHGFILRDRVLPRMLPEALARLLPKRR